MTPRTERKVARVIKEMKQEREQTFIMATDNFCSLNCQNDWFDTHGDNAINHFGRVEKPIILTEDNAWQKQWNRAHWDDNTQPEYIEVNQISRATRPCEQGRRVMAQQNEEHFEVIDRNKDVNILQRTKIKYTREIE